MHQSNTFAVIHRRKLHARILATLLVQLSTITPIAWAKETLVANPAEFANAAKNAQAGDTIILKNGLWKEKRLRIQANGTSDQPITLKAETPGKVILRGKSSISVAGSHLILDGLWFQNPSTSDAIELRVDDTPAIDCRITNCAVTDTRPLSSSKSVTRFISLYGSRNRVDHCYFAGKITGGPSLVVWLAPNAESSHRIDHNHFGPREPLNKNGGETIRVGDSASSMLNATCIIEHNLFEKCNGETECISNKSCGNIYRNNTFKAVSGTLTLRHGNGCRVENNTFLGEGAHATGGIRIIGENHIITGNYLENLTGDDYRSGICLMLGIPNSAPSGYVQVKHAKVTANTLVNCEHNILIGMNSGPETTLPPIGSEVSNNIIISPKGKVIESRCPVDQMVIKNNETRQKSPNDVRPALPEPAGPTWER